MQIGDQRRLFSGWLWCRRSNCRSRRRLTFDGRNGNHRRRSRRGRERFDEFATISLRIRINELDDAFHPGGNRSGFQIEIMRTRDGDMRHGLVHLEELQPLMGEGLTQRCCNLHRESALVGEKILHHAPQTAPQ